MQEELWKRIRNWICEKAGHPFRSIKWIHGGKIHFDCEGCGKIISKDILAEAKLNDVKQANRIAELERHCRDD